MGGFSQEVQNAQTMSESQYFELDTDKDLLNNENVNLYITSNSGLVAFGWLGEWASKGSVQYTKVQ